MCGLARRGPLTDNGERVAESTFPCLICEQDVHADVPSGGVHGGVQAFISGGYGSAVYDPIASAETHGHAFTLHAVICDACLLAKGRSGILVQAWRPPQEIPPLQTELWVPHDEPGVTGVARSRAAEAQGEAPARRPRRR